MVYRADRGSHSTQTPHVGQVYRFQIRITLGSAYQVSEKIWKILKYKTIKDRLPPTIKVSPSACIPHKIRQYHVIPDICFYLHVNGKYLSLVNDTTVKTDPQESMGQLGSTLKRPVSFMADNYNLDSPFIITKLDIANSFWYLVVSHIQAWNLCYFLSAFNVWPVSLGNTELVVPT